MEKINSRQKGDQTIGVVIGYFISKKLRGLPADWR